MKKQKYVHPIVVTEIVDLEASITAASIDLTIGGPGNSTPEITNFENQTEIDENFDFNL